MGLELPNQVFQGNISKAKDLGDIRSTDNHLNQYDYFLKWVLEIKP